MSATPFKRLAYVYMGTADYITDHYYYKNVLGARLVWEFERFGAKVAAFDLCGEPYLLLADHVREPSKRLMYEVENLKTARSVLEKRGWKPDGNEFEVPDGPCVNFKDSSGNEFALIEMKRPRMLERSYKG
jgi:hypothetical protein